MTENGEKVLLNSNGLISIPISYLPIHTNSPICPYWVSETGRQSHFGGHGRIFCILSDTQKQH